MKKVSNLKFKAVINLKKFNRLPFVLNEILSQQLCLS